MTARDYSGILAGMVHISGDYYTVAEAAAMTGTSTDLWVKRCKGVGRNSKIDGVLWIGRQWLIPRAAIDDYIANPPRAGRPRKDHAR